MNWNGGASTRSAVLEIAPRIVAGRHSARQLIRLYSSPAVSTIFSTPCCACSTTVAATRLTRATGDRELRFRRAAFLRAPPRFAADRFRLADVFRPPDFRLDARPPRRERFDALPRFRAPDDRDLREPPRDDFFLDAMNPLLVRGWWPAA